MAENQKAIEIEVLRYRPEHAGLFPRIRGAAWGAQMSKRGAR